MSDSLSGRDQGGLRFFMGFGRPHPPRISACKADWAGKTALRLHCAAKLGQLLQSGLQEAAVKLREVDASPCQGHYFGTPAPCSTARTASPSGPGWCAT